MSQTTISLCVAAATKHKGQAMTLANDRYPSRHVAKHQTRDNACDSHGGFTRRLGIHMGDSETSGGRPS